MAMKKRKHDDRAHSQLPPSASSRWLKCAPSMGYVNHLITKKVIKKRVSGDSAERGTRIHELAEPMITQLITKNKLPSPAKGVDPDEYDEAAAYALFCHELYMKATDIDDDVMYGVELKAHVTDECWGSADFWIYSAKRLTTVDLKTGTEPVDAKDNTQLLLYALGTIRTAQITGDVREIESIIYQPNARGYETPTDGHTYTVAEFTDHTKRLLTGIREATTYLQAGLDEQTLTARLEAGDHCRWCDALAVCHAAKSRALSTISTGFEPVPVDAPLPDPSRLEPHQVSEILRRAPMFSKWLEAVQVRAIEIAQRGQDIPGFKVVAKITRRAWRDDHPPAKIAKALKLPVAALTETKMLSPSKVEKLLKGDARKRVTDFTYRPVGTPTIVPESDRRQAIESSKINFIPVSQSEEET